MRAHEHKGGVTVNAVAGTRVVFLGLDLDTAKHEDCLGFAIERHDVSAGKTDWLHGKKTFEPRPKADSVSTHDHPVQAFWWADYEVEPGHSYSYRVVPRYGTSPKLKGDAGVTVDIKTEPTAGKHAIFFNRGAMASQEYAHEFDDKRPSKITPPAKQSAAYEYLSHGLYEALLAFIARAGSGFSLFGAFYDFNWEPVLRALGDARDRGAKVQIVYDAIPGGTPIKKSPKCIADAHIQDLCTPRTKGQIMHNKFLVLCKADKPVAVWTGSTNVSENGIFGHLNVGHSVDDGAVAAAYLKYWQQLALNPDPGDQQAWIEANNPVKPFDAAIATVFSPHDDDTILERYRDIAGSANDALFMTFAFGMNQLFKDVYGRDDGVLRLALMEDYGASSNKAKEKPKIEALQRLKDVVISIGGRVPLNGFDAWAGESPGLTNNVQWIHTKFMVVDPLSKSPTVVTGSANFSSDSTSTNDENMLVIRGDKRVGDIYFTEYMRLFSHYAFREAVGFAIAKGEKWKPGSLATDWKDWLPQYFQPGDKDIRRRYFATA